MTTNLIDRSTDVGKPIIDWLTYRSYETQRILNPGIEYYRWRAIYRDAVHFEEIYDQNWNRIYGVEIS